MVGRVSRCATLVGLLVALATWSAPAAARADRFDLRAHVEQFWTSVRQDGARDRLFGRGRDEQVAVGRFSSEGGPSFTLDQSGARPLLRFEGSSEIWALRPSAGVRGDIYYRNDIGEVVLRATRIGGLTLYTAANPGGLPCALEGGARRLGMRSFNQTSLFQHFLRETARGNVATGGRLFIEAQDIDDGSAAIVGDAVTLAVDAMLRLNQTQSGRERLAGLNQLEIQIATSPGVRRVGPRLVVAVTPRLGPAGRPSSARIVRALED